MTSDEQRYLRPTEGSTSLRAKSLFAQTTATLREPILKPVTAKAEAKKKPPPEGSGFSNSTDESIKSYLFSEHRCEVFAAAQTEL